MNIIFQIWSELIYRKCYFYKLGAFKMKPKNMFAAFPAVSHTPLPRFVFGFGFFFSHVQLSNSFKQTQNGDAYCLEP